ncbi:MAG: AI-2E family transporter, partial [Gammaproteobacteria bacterium]|nr:AI-2E family transporter [Gammaproteobacteria bacterium]
LAILKTWFTRYFSDPQAVLLTAILIIGFAIVINLGSMLAPVFAAVVIAYLLEGVVRKLERRSVPRIYAVIIVFLLFNAFVIFIFIGLVPPLSEQVTALIKELPRYLGIAKQQLLELPQEYSFISEKQVADVMEVINREIASFGQKILAVSLASITSLITIMVYLILVPMLIFFFLKDKKVIIDWFVSLLPKDRSLTSKVWGEMDQQLGNYVRGKFLEIVIVGVVSFIAFAILGLKYSILLGTLVGISVLVPYIGATIVTIPVAMVAYFQWGWGSDFAVLMTVYLIIQALDGNVVVPVLFSEVVNLHPIAIIVSVLFFGGLWGFWGIFFAIPLATLVNSVFCAWPRFNTEVAEIDL